VSPVIPWYITVIVAATNVAIAIAVWSIFSRSARRSGLPAAAQGRVAIGLAMYLAVWLFAAFFVAPRLGSLVGQNTGAVPPVLLLAGAAPAKVSFGPFCLLPTQFLLREGDKPVALGSRALQILIALLERRGELVSKQDLMARVWPNIFVEPANLTVHMSALRRALRDGRDGHRFIVNIPGRGYCFVASIDVSGHEN